MSYCTQSDITEQLDEDILIQLTDDAGSGAVDASIVARAIEDADAEIDGYCGARYDVPFAAVPAIVRRWSVEMAIYHLYSRRMGAPAERKTRYDHVLKTLQAVARGDFVIGGGSPAPSADAGVDVSVVKSDRLFSLGRTSDGSTGTLDNY